jgi:hypothetical protein
MTDFVSVVDAARTSVAQDLAGSAPRSAIPTGVARIP